MLVRRTDLYQTQIANYVPRTQESFQQRTMELSRELAGHQSVPNSVHGAQSLLYHELGQQALLWSFIDLFRWAALLAAFCVVLVWLFKKIKPGKRPVTDH